MYLPSKPNKYGIEIMMLCDVKTKYLINGIPYLGKDSNPSGLPLGAYYTKELTKTIHGTNRNVTMDNWFTSIPLAKDMLSSHQLTIVGTLRSNKKEIPPEMSNEKSRKIGSVMFAYNNELVLVSYKAKKSKMVFLLSTTHENGTVSETTGKPDIVEFYNSTKGAVDTFDEMSSNMSCSHKTQRWPLCIFYGMVNSTLVNAYVIYVHNSVKEKKKPINRREFAKQLERCTDYVHQQDDFTLVKWFLKARTELILLNKYSFDCDVKTCSLCNLKEDEGVPHFIARCPVLAEIRTRHLRKSILSEEELRAHLNGQHWQAVSRYCREACQYTFFLVQQFNF
ncbi:uncharacterized protein LOC120354734 [Nilaparvata lugens]|uniref:uncharacterized protein LOC120354734 n=1 Tax=Nilaparvata lugens TaxID=108931 RepID=UPI00193CD9A5|nr:uncharacterized protein LOC120354734 [Nilaparvata lugens]